MSTDIWLFEEPPRRLSQIERRSCQLQRELEHWLFLPTLSMGRLSKKGAKRSSCKCQQLLVMFILFAWAAVQLAGSSSYCIHIKVLMVCTTEFIKGRPQQCTHSNTTKTTLPNSAHQRLPSCVAFWTRSSTYSYRI